LLLLLFVALVLILLVENAIFSILSLSLREMKTFENGKTAKLLNEHKNTRTVKKKKKKKTLLK
jgi:hypothetical protein